MSKWSAVFVSAVVIFGLALPSPATAKMTVNVTVVNATSSPVELIAVDEGGKDGAMERVLTIRERELAPRGGGFTYPLRLLMHTARKVRFILRWRGADGAEHLRQLETELFSWEGPEKKGYEHSMKNIVTFDGTSNVTVTEEGQ